jgi:hypothetical protein
MGSGAVETLALHGAILMVGFSVTLPPNTGANRAPWAPVSGVAPAVKLKLYVAVMLEIGKMERLVMPGPRDIEQLLGLGQSWSHRASRPDRGR